MLKNRRSLIKSGMFGFFSVIASKKALASGAAASHPSSLSIEERLQRQEDIHRVNNVMNLYESYLQMGYLQDALDTFALKTPGVRAEIGVWGIWEGEASVTRLYLGFHNLLLGNQVNNTGKPGAMYIMPNTHTTIEVANDGKTAKGLWTCPGLSTTPNKNGGADAYWSWARRATDFVKENGQWKIWHYKVWGLLYTPFGTPWSENPEVAHMDGSWIPDPFKPDRPSAHNWSYSTKVAMDKDPRPPVPYETFSKTFSY